jgi:hypothetical protein
VLPSRVRPPEYKDVLTKLSCERRFLSRTVEGCNP